MMKTTMSLAVLALIGEISAVELKNDNQIDVDDDNFDLSNGDNGQFSGMDDVMLLETFSAINSYSSSELQKKHKKKHHKNLHKSLV